MAVERRVVVFGALVTVLGLVLTLLLRGALETLRAQQYNVLLPR